MVKKYERKLYSCDICGFGYKEKEYAQRCKDFCKAHRGCSMEIAKHAVKKG